MINKIAALTFYVFVLFAGALYGVSLLETKYFPVVSEFKVTQYKDLSIGWTEVHGTFEKHRDCSLVGLNMFHRMDDSKIPIQYIWLEPSQIRIEGSQLFGPWNIQVPSINLDNVAIESIHNCHPIFDTKTISKFVVPK